MENNFIKQKEQKEYLSLDEAIDAFWYIHTCVIWVTSSCIPNVFFQCSRQKSTWKCFEPKLSRNVSEPKVKLLNLENQFKVTVSVKCFRVKLTPWQLEVSPTQSTKSHFIQNCPSLKYNVCVCVSIQCLIRCTKSGSGTHLLCFTLPSMQTQKSVWNLLQKPLVHNLC